MTDHPHSSAKPNATHSGKNRLRKWLKFIFLTLIIAGLAWLLLAPEPLEVEVAAVTQGPMEVSIDNQGQVRAHDKYIVAAPVAAELQRIDVHEGDEVSRDRPLVTLNPLPMDVRQKEEALARLEAARALAKEAGLRVKRSQTELEFARSERARIERLVANNFVSPQAADKARTAEMTSLADWNAARLRQQAATADAKAAQAALAAAGMPAGDESARQVKLSSPVDGYVIKVHEKSARTVAAGTPLITIGDPTRYEIVVDVLSTDAVKIRPGQTMLLEGWGGGRTLRARVRLVEPIAFTKISALGVEEQRVNVIADPVDPLGPLGDGYRIEARIVIWSAPNVVKVAGSSLFRVGQEWHVFAVENGRAKERKVDVGHRNQDEAEILAGLEAGVRVVRFPGNQMRDGVRITPTNGTGG